MRVRQECGAPGDGPEGLSRLLLLQTHSLVAARVALAHQPSLPRSCTPNHTRCKARKAKSQPFFLEGKR